MDSKTTFYCMRKSCTYRKGQGRKVAVGCIKLGEVDDDSPITRFKTCMFNLCPLLEEAVEIKAKPNPIPDLFKSIDHPKKYFTINDAGICYMSSWLYKAMGRPKGVNLYLDRDNRSVGLEVDNANPQFAIDEKRRFYAKRKDLSDAVGIGRRQLLEVIDNFYIFK